MTETMRAIYFYAPKDIRLIEAPLPDPGPGEALVKIGAALTCGTDFKAFGRGHAVMLPHPPSPFGHEMAGTIVKLGRGAAGFKNGQRVVVGDSAPCECCFFCRRDQSYLCERFAVHTGAYAEYNLVPASIVKHKMIAIPDALDFAAAALAEPLACAVHAVQSMRVEAGETTAVLGAGPMALLLIQVLLAQDARVIVIGKNPENLARAKAAGAHAAFSSLSQDPAAAVRGATEGRGADCVFEAVGLAQTWRQSVDLARKGGRVCFFGGCAPETSIPIDAHRLHYEELEIRGVFHHTPEHFRAAASLIAAGKISPQSLPAARISLDDVPRFFNKNQGKSAPKTAVIP
ncbi:MAG: zinc-dependent alcohol dehydrogenase [Elusimicrobiota bacterium]